MQEYQREKLLEKIQEKMDRAEQIKLQKQQMQEQRTLMRKEIDQQKRELQ